jgi:uncharacterized OB-fold protein
MNIKDQIIKKIKDGILLSAFCPRCKKYVWPPSNNCRECLETTELKCIYNRGILLETSFSHLADQQCFFGIGEFSGIRIIGKVESNIKVYDFIFISKVKMSDTNRIIVEFKRSDN